MDGTKSPGPFVTAPPTDPDGATVLVVDDLDANVQLLSRFLSREGYTVQTASDGDEAFASVMREIPDVILSDVIMPRLNGFELCRRLKQNHVTRLVPIVLVTALNDRESMIQGIDAGADDFLSKPFDFNELKARVRSHVRCKRYTDDLDSADAVIMSLAMTIEARDRYTEGHCRRLAAYATAFGRRLGLGDEDLAALYRGGFLHDIGKIGIPDAILLKPTTLTPTEHDTIKQHTVIGDELCGQLRSLSRVRPIVRSHHERLDGSGYPDGLRGEQIPLLAQILSIVDIYDAIRTARPYKPAMSIDRAREELLREVDGGWRRGDLVREFLALVPALASLSVQ